MADAAMSAGDGASADNSTLNERLASLEAQLESLRSSSTLQQLEAEQQLHDLSSQVSTANQLAANEKAASLAASEREQALQERVKSLEQEVQQVNSAGAGVQEKQSEWNREREDLLREKRDLLQLLDQQKQENRQLQDSLDSVRGLFTSLQTSHSNLETSFAEANSVSRSSLLKIQTLEATITSLTADKQFLTTELERGRTEWSTFRRESHEQIIQLQTQLENSEIEQRQAQTLLNSLKTAHEQLKTRHQETLTSLSLLREQSETNQGNFQTEMTSMKRLLEMLEKREDERKNRLEKMEQNLEIERENLLEREETIKEELETERARCDELENRNIELRQALERGANSFNSNQISLEGQDSPSPHANSSFALSPSGQLAVRGQRTGRSYAEIYSEYMRMEEDLIKERAETQRLSECLSEILSDIEERAPLLKEQRSEYERLSLEATDLATRLTQADQERDAALKQAESYRLDKERLQQETNLLAHQLKDLGRQVRTLARSIAVANGTADTSQGDTADEFDEEEAEIARRAEFDPSTDAVVSAHLVTFRSINELQLQNQKLLKITREMGEQMEQREENALNRRRYDENSAVKEAHELILRLKDEVESQRARMEAFEKERDMYRRMLGTGQILPSSTTTGNDSAATGDSGRLLAEVQANFDAYRNEISIDSERLRQDLKDAQHAAAQARTELAKSKAQAEFTQERFRLLTESFELQTGELRQASTRLQQVQKNAAKQENLAHQLSEDLRQVRASAEQLRHENTNLKSEREVSKSVQNRLQEENLALSRERSHLADLMRNLQTMQNEIERSGAEARNRLEEQLARSDSQANDAKIRLSQEIETNRQTNLRKELEIENYKHKLENLVSEHQTTRENLLVATTSKEHLEQRVADLTTRLSSSEEKLAIYEGRSNATGATEDSTQSAEQRLQVTVAELRGELRSAQTELQRALTNVEQFKSIAHAEGTALSELTSTYETYQQTTDAKLAEKESELSSLRERLNSITEEISSLQTQNSELFKQADQEKQNFAGERKSLEDLMVQLRAAETSAREAQLAAQDDLRRQAQLAKEAHEKYERELLAHAEDVQKLSATSQELEIVRASVSQAETDLQLSKANFLTSEQSWKTVKQTLENELKQVETRCEDLAQQNSVLHQHLETFGQQANKLQQARLNADTDESDTSTAAVPNSEEQLRQVIKFVREEKQILQFQLDLTKQEATRLTSQLEYTTRNLQETKQTLSEEREKAADSSTSSAQHAELLERIHTAKLLRESNQTLRDENETSLRKISTLEIRLQAALGELEPLRERVMTLQAEIESKAHTVKLLEEDNERWKLRNSSILAKYERIDPEELIGLKTELEAAQADKARLEAELGEQTKLAESMRDNWVNGQGRFKALQTQARMTRDEKNKLQTELDELKTKMESTTAKTTETDHAQQTELTNQINALQEKVSQLEAEISSLQNEKISLETKLNEQTEKVTQLEQNLAEQAQRPPAETAAAAPAVDQSERVSELEQALAQLTAEKEKIEAARALLARREQPIFQDNQRMKREQKEHANAMTSLQSQLNELTRAKEEFEKENSQAIENLVNERVKSIETSQTKPSDEEIEAKIKFAVQEAEAVAKKEREAAVEEAIKSTTAKMESSLQALKTEMETMKSSAESGTNSEANSEKHSQELSRLKTEFEATISNLKTEFDRVKENLAEQAKKRETEITEVLTSEIKKLTEAAATSPSGTAATSAAPPNLDEIVAQKIASLEPERLAQQTAAIEAALSQQAAAHSEQLSAALEANKKSLEAEATQKGKLMLMQKNKIAKQLEQATKLLQEHNLSLSAATATTTPATTPAAAAAANGATRGRGASRGGARGGAAAAGRGASAARGGRGGGAAGAATTTAAQSAPVAVPVAPVTGLSLRGAAASAAQPVRPGGVLGNLLGAAAGTGGAAAAAAKRARESEEGSSTAEATKRAKPGPAGK